MAKEGFEPPWIFLYSSFFVFLLRMKYFKFILYHLCMNCKFYDMTLTRDFTYHFEPTCIDVMYDCLKLYKKTILIIYSKVNFTHILYLIRLLYTGVLVLPDPKSANYVSSIGHLDTRLNLDAIKRKDIRYYVALSMMASKASYENEAFLKTTVEEQWKVLNFISCFHRPFNLLLSLINFFWCINS